MAAHTQDDGFHEIQLSGKQLVFLFMSVTVVSVVLFLLGVLVGRNVRSAQDLERRAAAATAEPAADLSPVSTPPAVMTGSTSTPSATPGGRDGEAPAARSVQVPTDELRPDPPSAPVAIAPAVAKPVSVPAAALTKPAPAAPVNLAKTAKPAAPSAVAAAPATATATAASGTGASTSGWVVQLAALNDRREAEEIARRLVSKGYEAFVATPASGNPAVFRVRVGSFKTKNEADLIGAKLKKEERFDPWITR